MNKDNSKHTDCSLNQFPYLTIVKVTHPCVLYLCSPSYTRPHRMSLSVAADLCPPAFEVWATLGSIIIPLKSEAIRILALHEAIYEDMCDEHNTPEIEKVQEARGNLHSHL